MLTAIYKSPKKADTYLFVTKRDDFSNVPAPLLETFGTPVYVMMVDLARRTKLGIADLETVKQKLTDDGFYLQLPPHTESLLDEFKKQNGVTDS